MLVRWFPRRPMPPLLLVLHGGLAWLPIAFALYTAQDLAFARDGVTILGKTPADALFIGFFGTLPVFMVSGDPQGHCVRTRVRLPVAADPVVPGHRTEERRG